MIITITLTKRKNQELVGPLLKSLIPFKQQCLERSLVEIGLVILEMNTFKFCQCNFAIS